ncbi:MAG TPA: AgmX/PglI C-terminal domain-containing protein [Pseudobdellovibrionaceae bacterium]|nr:AgmX/PglI C-terminal domain-containing protein [Pseudobdellovibrionaceae bacterium]
MSTPIILRVYKGHQLVLVKQFEQDQISLGSSSSADIELLDDLVTSLHAMIEKRANKFYLMDLGSETGTIFNKNKILEIELESNSRFEVGPFECVFSVGLPKTEKPQIKEVKKEPKIVNTQAVNVQIDTTSFVETKTTVEAKTKEKKKVPQPPLPKYIKPTLVSSGNFAPESQIPELKRYLKPSKGPVVEILVAWGDRILHSYHFKKNGVYRSGSLGQAPIFIPASILPRGWPLLDIKSDALINLPVGSELEINDGEKIWTHEELDKKGRIQKNFDKSHFRLKQNEILFVRLVGTDLVLIFRQVPATSKAPLSTPFLLSTDEWMGLIGSLVIVTVFILYVLARIPEDIDDKPKEPERIAQIIVERPFVQSPIVKNEPVLEEKQTTPPPPVKPQEKPEKVKLDDKNQSPVDKGQNVAQGKKSNPKKAAEAAPKLFKDLPKKYSSVKKGGGVKLGKTPGGGASSDQNPKEFGLMGALGSGGVREKIDQAYKGSGEVLGMGEQATGTSGFDADRKGQDLGSKVQDSGAGGKGIATHGISGVGVKGKSSGMSEYGSSKGLGDKSRVQVVAGGAEEAFVGSIDKEAVRRVIRENIREIQSCYERGLNQLPKGTRLEGRVTIRWTIVAKGHAEDVKVKDSTLGNQKIESCIRDRIASWNYPEPPPGLEGDVEYPFYLKPIN